MIDSDKSKFSALISGVYSFYRADTSAFAIGVWWEAMKPYELPAIQQAMNRHAMNPDSGQFLPKPADIVRMLQGTTADSALAAWGKVDKAIRFVGPWRSVCFDDPIIQRVLADMGGWAMLGQKTEKELDFIQNEFVTRYRGFKMRSERPSYPSVLAGLAEMSNSEQRRAVEPPTLIGSTEIALLVYQQGDLGKPGITAVPMAQALTYGAAQAPRLKA